MAERIEEIKDANDELEEMIEEKLEEMTLEQMPQESDETMLEAPDMPPPLSDREVAELLYEKSKEIETSNRELGEDLSKEKRYEKALEKREEVAKSSYNLSMQTKMKLQQEDLNKSDLFDVLPTISEVLDKSWEMTHETSAAIESTQKDIHDLERNLDRTRKNNDLSQGEKKKRIEKVSEKLDDTQKMLEADMKAVRKSQEVALKAVELNRLALNHLATHMQQNMDQMSVNEMFEMAKMLEELLAKNFAHFRAQELAQIQQTSIDEALAKTFIPQQNRPDLSEQLNNQNINTIGDLNNFRQSLEEAMNQVEGINAQAQSMLDQAKGLNQQRLHGTTMNMAAMQRMMNNAAFAQRGQRQMMDMTQAMRTINWMGGQGDAYHFDSKDNRGDGGEFFKPQSQSAPKRLNSRTIKSEAMPGRKFTEDSKRKGWLYLDTWYVIGPWDNNGRIDYTVTHPPETLIDLDAEYEGKINKKTRRPMNLEWQFFQSSKLRHTPPDERSNSTYYAYTEVYFEKETEMLLAVGTDDAAKVWINNLVVWRDEGLSSWNLEEGYRKVLFKKGYNKILIRVENGPAVCQFSVLLCPPDALPKI